MVLFFNYFFSPKQIWQSIQTTIKSYDLNASLYEKKLITNITVIIMFYFSFVVVAGRGGGEGGLRISGIPSLPADNLFLFEWS